MVLETLPPLPPPAPSLMRPKEEESIVPHQPNSLPPSESQDDSNTIDDSAESAQKFNYYAPKPDSLLDLHHRSRRDLISSDAELFSSSDDAHSTIPRSPLTDWKADEYTLPTSQSMVGLKKKKKPRKSARFSADRSTK
ncbi:hypothetical protein BLNAU_1326 [Blattamonas nauphoetae]|uniref:Uncharacterized protein n=1 Tax=Blattamonas nauphoetae TaxID=2049346 RepID=A0ABQ9YJ14_9EUKA|nr:hypothetical protein BLNAU_1326 [Blattamonas nauphoetae]